MASSLFPVEGDLIVDDVFLAQRAVRRELQDVELRPLRTLR